MKLLGTKKEKKKENVEKIELEILLQASEGAAKRVRLILIVMVIASSLAIGSLWNSLEFSWRDKRLQRLGYLAQHSERIENLCKDVITKLANTPTPESTKKLKSLSKHFENKNLKEIGQNSLLNIQENKFLINCKHDIKVEKIKSFSNLKFEELSSKIDLSDCNNNIECSVRHQGSNITLGIFQFGLEEGDYQLVKYSYAHILNSTELNDYFLHQLKIRNNYLRFNIPLFDISFDINDLGVVGGIGFSIILFTLYISLIRERNNIEIAFETSEKVFCQNREARREFYKFLSMNQLLSITPTGSGGNLLTTKIARFLFLLSPTIFSFLIFLNDCRTLTVGAVLDPNSFFTIFNVTFSFLLALVVVSFTIRCRRQILAIDLLWKEEDEKIKLIENK